LKFIIGFECIWAQNKGAANTDVTGLSKNGAFERHQNNRPAYWYSWMTTSFNSCIHMIGIIFKVNRSKKPRVLKSRRRGKVKQEGDPFRIQQTPGAIMKKIIFNRLRHIILLYPISKLSRAQIKKRNRKALQYS